MAENSKKKSMQVKLSKRELVYKLINKLKENLTEIIDDDGHNSDDGPSTSTRYTSRLRRYASNELAQLNRKEALQRAMDAYSDDEDSDDEEHRVHHTLFEVKRFPEIAGIPMPSKAYTRYQYLNDHRQTHHQLCYEVIGSSMRLEVDDELDAQQTSTTQIKQGQSEQQGSQNTPSEEGTDSEFKKQ